MKNKTCNFLLTMFLFGLLVEAAFASDMSVWRKYALSKKIETTSLSDTSISATSGMTKTKAAALFNQQKWTQAQSAYTSLFVLFPKDMDIVRGLSVDRKSVV